MNTWRDSARPIIADVIASCGKEDTKALRHALRDAYPWGERKYWPYKVWCDEIRVQLGLRHFNPIHRRGKIDDTDLNHPDQLKLFE